MIVPMACQTAGCPQEGVVLDVDTAPLDLETGQPITITDVYCGDCNQLLAAAGV